MTASNRREVFEFQNYGEDEEYQNEQFDEDKLEQEFMGPVAEVNMKKNKGDGRNGIEGKILAQKARPVENKKDSKPTQKK